jgi:hypothetical protein
MTTIAWDGKTLAADRMMVAGGLKLTARKLFDCGAHVYGGSGSAAEVTEIAEWIRSGADPAKAPAFEESSHYGLVVRRTDAAIFYVMGKKVQLIATFDKHAAAGCGQDLAIAAMATGKSAVRAVNFAARFNAFTGLGVDSVRIRPAKR